MNYWMECLMCLCFPCWAVLATVWSIIKYYILVGWILSHFAIIGLYAVTASLYHDTYLNYPQDPSYEFNKDNFPKCLKKEGVVMIYLNLVWHLFGVLNYLIFLTDFKNYKDHKCVKIWIGIYSLLMIIFLSILNPLDCGGFNLEFANKNWEGKLKFFDITIMFYTLTIFGIFIVSFLSPFLVLTCLYYSYIQRQYTSVQPLDTIETSTHREERLTDCKPIPLFHQTSKEAAVKILVSQMFKRGSSGYAGGGIYFAVSSDDTTRKAVYKGGWILEAKVKLGNILTINKPEAHDFHELNNNGYDSVLITSLNGNEYVVYNWDQVSDIKIHRRPKFLFCFNRD